MDRPGVPVAAPHPARLGAERAGPRWLPLGAVGLITGLTVLRDPHVPGSWAVCPTYALFGVYCPGCGSLRALHDLGVGRIAESIGHNALVIPAVLFVLASTVAPDLTARVSGRWARIWLVAFLAFAVLRNLPGSPLAP